MSKLTELTAKLNEILQIDRPDLDFGIYRVINARAGEITDYLARRLPERVKTALGEGGQSNLDTLKPKRRRLPAPRLPASIRTMPPRWYPCVSTAP